MRKSSIALALGVCALMMLAVAAPAQKKRTSKSTPKKKVSAYVNPSETGLVGIKLYDTGSRVVAIYGSPDEIQPVTLGGGSGGPGGGAAGGAGGRGLPGGGGPPGAPTSAGGPSLGFAVPGDFGFGDSMLDSMQGVPGDTGGGPRAMKPGGGGGGAVRPGGGGGGAVVGGGGGGTGGGGMSGSTGDRVIYTRWVYNRNASKYGFILDKYNRVVQCEAIGIQAGKARTRKGITFGSSFASIIKKYGAPDGYEMAGDNIVVRYLSKNKCAFRLSRLGENKPSVVTGIVVAAGKR